jgi:hypothetical protein
VRLGERLRRLDERLLGDPPPPQPEPSQRMERRLLALYVLGLFGMALALALASDTWWGITVALLSCWLLGGPYIDLRARRWFLRR